MKLRFQRSLSHSNFVLFHKTLFSKATLIKVLLKILCFSRLKRNFSQPTSGCTHTAAAKMESNVLQAGAGGLTKHPVSIPTKGYLKIQMFVSKAKENKGLR